MKCFDSEFFKANRDKLRRAFSVDAPIVISAHGSLQKSGDEPYSFRQESNFWYLCGLDEPNFVLVIDKDEAYLIAPKRSEYLNVFSGELDKEKIQRDSGVSAVLDHTKGWGKLSARLKKSKEVGSLKPPPDYIDQLGMYTNPAGRSLMAKITGKNPRIKLRDVRTHMARLRSIKSEDELRCIRRATDESVKLHRAIADNFTRFKTERDLIAFIKSQGLRKDLDTPYEPITASGKNAAVLHYQNGRSKLNPNEPVLVDAAFSYQKYSSDITRVYCARPSKRYEQIQNAVVEVQQYAIGLLKPRARISDYENLVDEFMGKKLKKLGLIKKTDKKSIKQYYPHRTSHFLGLDTHDVGDPEKPLEPGMVLTVEPGIYVPEESIGVRIEDDVLITAEGNEVLSSDLPK